MKQGGPLLKGGINANMGWKRGCKRLNDEPLHLKRGMDSATKRKPAHWLDKKWPCLLIFPHFPKSLPIRNFWKWMAGEGAPGGELDLRLRMDGSSRLHETSGIRWCQKILPPKTTAKNQTKPKPNKNKKKTKKKCQYMLPP